MDREALIDLRAKVNGILRAAERISALKLNLTTLESQFLSDIRRRLGEHRTGITEIEERVCRSQNTQWYNLAWSKAKNIPDLVYYRVTQLHSSSCRRSTQITPHPDPLTPKEFYTFLLALCLLYYTSCGGIVAFYNFSPASREATATTIATATNLTNVIPNAEPCHVADTVNPMQLASVIAIGFLLLVTSFVLLSLFLKFVILFPWSMYYSFWLAVHLFKNTSVSEQTEEQLDN